MFCPAATLEAHHKTDTAAGPVNEHTNPDAQQSCMKAQHQHITANHAEQPHTQNADCHRKTGVAAAAQGVRQCKAGSPEKTLTILNARTTCIQLSVAAAESENSWVISGITAYRTKLNTASPPQATSMSRRA